LVIVQILDLGALTNNDIFCTYEFSRCALDDKYGM